MENVSTNIKTMLPSHIDFAITYKCNAHCKHCSINADDIENKRKNLEMSKEDIFRTLEQIAEVSPHLLALCGGEPILHPNIYEIIDFCKERKILTAMATNGLAINEDIVKKLVNHKLDGILVSLDHTEAKIHNFIRENDRMHQKAIEAIKLCVDNKIFTTVGITPMKQNYDNIFDIVELAIKLGANAVNLSTYIPTGRGSQEYDLTNEEWKKLVLNWLSATEKYKDVIRLQIHEPRVNIYKKSNNYHINGMSGCLAGFSHCYILPDGSVTPCVMLPYVIGNLKQNSIRDIIFQYQTGKNVYDKSRLKGNCSNCEFKQRCGGCRALAYAYTSDVYESDPRCWIKVNNLKE